MSQQVQELINKIKNEGLQEAEKQAQATLTDAEKKRREILDKAQAEAKQKFDQAQAEAQKVEQSTRLALQQVARDTLLKLRGEMNAVLARLLARDIQQAMTPELMAGLIERMTTGYLKNQKEPVSVEVVLSETDFQQLKSGYLKKLQDTVKQSLTLRSSENVSSGFTISFDEGRTSFDFSDESLVEFLTTSLSQEVSTLLKDAISSK